MPTTRPVSVELPSDGLRTWFAVPTAMLLLLLACTVTCQAAEPSAEDLKFFEIRIRPLLAEYCGDCHGADEAESELRLDSYAGMVSGGKSGPAVVPGNLSESLLVAAISYQDESLRMPPDRKLPEADVQLLKEWISKGAPHPEMNGPVTVLLRRGAIDIDEARKFWSFQPVARPVVPKAADSSWVKTPVDAFILEELQAKGLEPVAAADKRTLLRRATFDLTGLPPTPAEVASFLADESPHAFETVVDRLLASPQYGERWGRHWLDVVRYADSNGLDENVAHVDAWRYRDYVIAAFNADKPFDCFLREQIAGDLLLRDKLQASGRAEMTPEDYELLVATGFLTLGAKVLAEKDQAKMQMDIIDEQIDALSQAVLGLTIACARCHDHKFDPISTEDYYALAGIFKSTKTMESYATIAKWSEHVLATPAEVEQKKQRDEAIAAKQKEIKTFTETANAELLKQMGAAAGTKPPADAEQKYPEETRQRLTALRQELDALKAANPDLPTAMAVREGEAADTRIHVRGSHLTLGKQVARGTPAVLTNSGPISISNNESGRLQLANWLTSPQNPLTARVAVNRIWRWHFGKGLTPTTDNFGKLGSLPTHPQLLDWLAAGFMESGWSMKAVHKQIMLSSTYQLSTSVNEKNLAADLDNQFYWRANVRRLEAEEIRDSLLAVSGLLDATPGGSLLKTPKWGHVFNHTSKDDTAYDSTRRSVYLPVIRNNLYDGFSLFDYSNADVPVGSREMSTVAPQALFMMNSDLLLKSSAALTERLFVEAKSDEARVCRLYELALSRDPTDAETGLLLKYVEHLEQALADRADKTDARHLAWQAVVQGVLASNEFIYLN
ncbi:PSD1 and planctomycete cytochrome C domain-containing protein [Planctomicrobium piriforme]|uniref:Planctomycete cytochrome C n=1 Tax=Planctomicrobium piriforme TaxID=1576369 RepID=A0A1I3INA8_9PLAN|nr:PSD1 and planctomycete cytochrome C domain-containing protein [Planctomicrobium piriforme]SFI49317.1 Planctomycete cytochrome C [Planctomicrobium piriforme]